ncbi:MAG: beta strand repeat-containing protein [Chthoniobacterales bacterium]
MPNNSGADVFVDGGKTGINSVVSVDGSFLAGRLTIDLGDSVNINNNRSLTISDAGGFSGAGTINNTGSISLNGVSSPTTLNINGNVTLTGGGTVTLTDGYDFIAGSGTLTNVNNTIQGGNPNGLGSIGGDQISVINQASGLILANSNASQTALIIDPVAGTGTFANQGTMRAANGGILQLTGNGGGTFDNTGGTIEALASSEVRLVAGAAISGGTLTTSGDGVIRVPTNASLTSLTSAGSFVGNDNSTTTLSGTINNTGSILLNGVSRPTSLAINGNVTLTGGGTVTLTDGYDFIAGSGTLTNVNNTIQGANSFGLGSIGGDQISVINQASGLILANDNSSGAALIIDPVAGTGTFANQGTMRATGGGTLVLSGNGGGTFANTGDIIADTNSTVSLTGALTQTAGSVSLNGGTLNNTGSLNIQGGLLRGNGTVNGPVSNSGTISPGFSVGLLTINGDLQLGSTANLSFEIGGTGQGTTYDWLNKTDGAALTLNGNLTLTLINGFTPANSDMFTIVSTQTMLAGAFANVANGTRLQTTDGAGSFKVTYHVVNDPLLSRNVTLSEFAPTLVLTSAASRKTHGGAGSFDINLPFMGEPGVECRTGGASGDYTLVFNFSNNIASGNASVTGGTGSVSGSPAFAGNTMTVNLTGVTDVQKITVTLSNATDDFGQVLPDTSVSMNVLLGDTTANKRVNASDVGQTKSQSGAPVSATNFREDVTVDGSINASDVGVVKSRSGNNVP